MYSDLESQRGDDYFCVPDKAPLRNAELKPRLWVFFSNSEERFLMHIYQDNRIKNWRSLKITDNSINVYELRQDLTSRRSMESQSCICLLYLDQTWTNE